MSTGCDIVRDMPGGDAGASPPGMFPLLEETRRLDFRLTRALRRYRVPPGTPALRNTALCSLAVYLVTRVTRGPGFLMWV